MLWNGSIVSISVLTVIVIITFLEMQQQYSILPESILLPAIYCNILHARSEFVCF